MGGLPTTTRNIRASKTYQQTSHCLKGLRETTPTEVLTSLILNPKLRLTSLLLATYLFLHQRQTSSLASLTSLSRDLECQYSQWPRSRSRSHNQQLTKDLNQPLLQLKRRVLTLLRRPLFHHSTRSISLHLLLQLQLRNKLNHLIQSRLGLLLHHLN